MKKVITALFLFSMAAPLAARADDTVVLRQLQLLNQVPEDQVNEKTDPGFSILRKLYDADGPDFLTLRKLLGTADVRARLNPSVKCIMAGIISQRWDTFTLSGNLYLAGLTSANPDLRDKARQKLVNFIQPAHIPVLIEILKTPGPNVLANEILQEVTGQPVNASAKAWRIWWTKNSTKVDIIGHLINDTRVRVQNHASHPFDQDRFWYLPEGVSDAETPYANRSNKEQTAISEWNNWANTNVRRYLDDWVPVKPVLDRIVHQPDPRVNKYLESLVNDPVLGDYASLLLAWRSNASSLLLIQEAFKNKPTVGRALARGSLGERAALADLLRMMDAHQESPLTYKIMDDDARNTLRPLLNVGVYPAEQAFELLCHHPFDFNAAMTGKEKKKKFREARAWLQKNATQLAFDRRRSYYTVPGEK